MILLLGLLAAGPGSAHTLQSSLTEVSWQPDGGRLEVVHSLHLDDAMVLLAALGAPGGNLSLHTEAALMLYLERNFTLSVKGQPLTLQAVGAEFRGDYLWLYQEQQVPGYPHGLTVRMTLMQEYFAAQQHQINFVVGDRVRTLRLDRITSQGTF